MNYRLLARSTALSSGLFVCCGFCAFSLSSVRESCLLYEFSGGNQVDGLPRALHTEAVGGAHGGQASAPIGTLGPQNLRFDRIREFTLPVWFDRVFHITVRLRMTGVSSEVSDGNTVLSSDRGSGRGRIFSKNDRNSKFEENRV